MRCMQSMGMLRGHFATQLSTTAFKGQAPGEHGLQEVAHNLSESIASNNEACTAIAEHLDEHSRQQLLFALVAAQPALSAASKARLDVLFREHDVSAPFNQLSRAEFEAALRAERATDVKKPVENLPEPSNFSIALANCIPFVGMGAVDNAIMLVAGSKIDAAFGAKLGLSTLAAAGLGNMVSDIAGVSMANRLEVLTRKSRWVNQIAYKAGNKTPRGRAAKLVGAVVGVSIGCVIGMAPLIFMNTHEHDDPSVHGSPVE